MLKNILIVGGSSGLGLELTKLYIEMGHTLFITGRKDPKIEGVKFFKLEVKDNMSDLENNIDEIIAEIPKVNTLVYAAGFYQEGHIDDLSSKQICEMINIGLTAPALFINKLKNNPAKPLKVMLITSSSGYTPRELEPLYCSTKAGLEMLGASLSFDQELGKVVVVSPSGMQTPFWRDSNKDTSKYLDPKWVAEQIVDLSGGPFKYKYARILKDPSRVVVVETKL